MYTQSVFAHEFFLYLSVGMTLLAAVLAIIAGVMRESNRRYKSVISANKLLIESLNEGILRSTVELIDRADAIKREEATSASWKREAKDARKANEMYRDEIRKLENELEEMAAAQQSNRGADGKFSRKPEDQRSERSKRRDRQIERKSRELADTFLAVSRGEMANPFDENTECKPHQLANNHTVYDCTMKQREEVLKVCDLIGVLRTPCEDFMKYQDIWYCEGRIDSACTRTYEDIVIPFDEFMARLNGEWVGPKPKTPLKCHS